MTSVSQYSSYTKKMLEQGYGYRVSGKGFRDLEDMLYREAVTLGNIHVPIEVAKKVGMYEYYGCEVEDYYTVEDLRAGQPYPTHFITDIVKRVKKKWGEGRVVWLATKEVVEERYVKELGFGHKKDIRKITIPDEAKILSDLGHDGALFFIPEGVFERYYP